MRDLEKKGGIKEVIKDGCIVKCLNLIPRVAIHETFGFQPNKCR